MTSIHPQVRWNHTSQGRRLLACGMRRSLLLSRTLDTSLQDKAERHGTTVSMHPDCLRPTWSMCYQQSSAAVAYSSTGLCEGQRRLLSTYTVNTQWQCWVLNVYDFAKKCKYGVEVGSSENTLLFTTNLCLVCCNFTKTGVTMGAR